MKLPSSEWMECEDSKRRRVSSRIGFIKFNEATDSRRSKGSGQISILIRIRRIRIKARGFAHRFGEDR